MPAIQPNLNAPIAEPTTGLITRAWSQFLNTLTRLPSEKLSGDVTYDPPILSATISTSTTVSVPGATLGWDASASFSLDLAGLMMTSYVSATDTVTVVLFNRTAGTVNLTSGTLTAYAWKP